ncbi:MAG: hydroxyacylglutathione hydrolase [Betaproteobacteria bacterium]|nr:hydroxyacylglutathione hydrolase [Betaproteobacteria bacterium]
MIQITPIPAFRDNYIWAIHDDRHAALVDPGAAAPVEEWLQAAGLTACAILVTHHHDDHCGGSADLARTRGIPVYGPAEESIPGKTHPVTQGEGVELPELGLSFAVLSTPGHTLGHVCYTGHGWAFTGDTLFANGCGRLFEGTPAQMYASLTQLAALPGDTKIYCAHEYTLANIAFALEVEEANPDLLAWFERARRERKAGRPTLPTTLDQERRTNPFLRCRLDAVKQAAEAWAGHPLANEVEVFASLRAWKNTL